MSSEARELVIHGKWSAFDERGEWRTFSIEIEGRNFPVKMSTKKEEVIDQMMAVRDKDATFTGTERDSERINPHNNLPYKDRYINKAELGHVGTPTSSGGGASTAGGKGGGGGGDYSPEAIARIEDGQRRDMRSRAWAHTVSALQHTFKADTPDDDHFKRLQSFQRRIYADIAGAWGDAPGDSPYMPEALRKPPAANPAPEPAAESADAHPGAPVVDDGIPY